MQIIFFSVNPDDLIPFRFVVHKVVMGWVLLGLLQFFISTNPSVFHASTSLT